MAQKTVVIYTDDLSGEESQEISTHTFSLNGVTYEIDLAPDSYDELAQALDRFIKSARKTGRGKGTPKPRVGKQASGGASAEEIRAWAKEQGITVSERGRVPSTVREQFEAAH